MRTTLVKLEVKTLSVEFHNTESDFLTMRNVTSEMKELNFFFIQLRR